MNSDQVVLKSPLESVPFRSPNEKTQKNLTPKKSKSKDKNLIENYFPLTGSLNKKKEK
jgi:hypothetical protein